MTIRRVVLAVVTAALLAPPAASAATEQRMACSAIPPGLSGTSCYAVGPSYRVSGGALLLYGGSGTNDIAISSVGNAPSTVTVSIGARQNPKLTWRDLGVSGCAVTSGGLTLTCPTTFVSKISYDAIPKGSAGTTGTLAYGPSNDFVTGSSAMPIGVYTGGGNDTVTLDNDLTTVDGGAGADRLIAEDIVYADLDVSSTRIAGGWTRTARTAPVTVKLTNSAGTGGSTIDDGVGDTIVAAYESVTGTAANDTMTASGATDFTCTQPTSFVADLHGGAGNDTLRGAQLFGDAGNDTLTVITNATRGKYGVYPTESWGGERVQVVDGGPGNDVLLGGSYPVVLRGGLGADYMSGTGAIVDYDNDTGRSAAALVTAGTGRTGAVNGSTDDAQASSAPTTRDTIAGDVRAIYARYTDTVTAGGPSQLAGGTVTGSTSGDTLYGVTVNGGDGGDTIRGKVVDGGPGSDRILGTIGNDTLHGGTGNDYINGDQGADLIDGGGDPADYLFYASKRDAYGRLDGPALPEIMSGHNLRWSDSRYCGSADPSRVGEVSYESAGVTVTLDGGPAGDDGGSADGPPGSRDTVVGMRWMYGTPYADTVTGSAAAERFYGLGGDDVFVGGGGPDVFGGDGGVDTMSYADHPANAPVTAQLGGSGVSAIDVGGDAIGADVERLVGGAGDDTLRGTDTAKAETLDGGDGLDTLYASGGSDTLVGGNGFDIVDYSARTTATTVSLDSTANDGALGEGDNVSSSVEQVTTGSGNDSLVGDSNDNLFVPGTGADSVDGKGGQDRVSYTDHAGGVTVTLGVPGAVNGNATDGAGDALTAIEDLTGGQGASTLTGDGQANLLTGNGGGDVLHGGGGIDTILGGGGDDTIDGGDGADVMYGGAGVDIADYSSRSEVITADIDGVTDDGGASDGPGGGHDQISTDIDGIRGGSGADTLIGSALLPNVLDGGPGNDTLDGLTGADQLIGGSGTDLVTYASRTAAVTATIPDGAASADDGEAGEGDAIANDVENLTGGTGDDALTGNSQDNVLLGGLGADTLVGNGGVDATSYADRNAAVTATIGGGAVSGVLNEHDTLQSLENLTGGSVGDTLHGDAGANRLDGGPGDDSLFGNGGADDLVGGTGSGDTARYDTRTTPVTASLIGVTSDNGGIEDGPVGARDTIEADVESIIGGSGNDTLTGDDSNNSLYGGSGDDTLVGNDGDDQFSGGNGADIIDGGNDSVAGDSASWYLSNQAITADLDNAMGDDGGTLDGPPGGRDSLLNIESIVGGEGGNTLTGNADDNGLTGGSGTDILSGGDGNDSFNGAGGPDTFNGGNGTQDTVSYAGRATSVTADIDGVAGDDGGVEDGTLGNRDTIATDIEAITGGNGADTLTGDDNKNYLTGGPGIDTLNGMGDGDIIFARDGLADVIDCGLGTDVLQSDVADGSPPSCESVQPG